MNLERFDSITAEYKTQKIAVIGDFCLDRYFEIDPALQEVSIETGLPVYNVVNTRCQPGGAGTVVNNLVALQCQCYPMGVCGKDGEGWELTRALARLGCKMLGWGDYESIRTFSYNKPLLLRPGMEPQELNRLDIKNRGGMPDLPRRSIQLSFETVVESLDACILMEQVDHENTGLLDRQLLDDIAAECRENRVLCIADSRLGLERFPAMIFKMNRSELEKFSGKSLSSQDAVREEMHKLAGRNQQPVFVTLAEEGICAANPDGEFFHEPAVSLPGGIDVVGAGDAVTANLAMALASGATLQEAMNLAMTAAAIVVHKLGTTGTATLAELRPFMPPAVDSDGLVKL